MFAISQELQRVIEKADKEYAILWSQCGDSRYCVSLFPVSPASHKEMLGWSMPAFFETSRRTSQQQRRLKIGSSRSRKVVPASCHFLDRFLHRNTDDASAYNSSAHGSSQEGDSSQQSELKKSKMCGWTLSNLARCACQPLLTRCFFNVQIDCWKGEAQPAHHRSHESDFVSENPTATGHFSACCDSSDLVCCLLHFGKQDDSYFRGSRTPLFFPLDSLLDP